MGRKKGVYHYNVADYINKQINKWTILRFAYVTDKGEQYWDAKCTCGTIAAVRASHIIRCKSLGCYSCRGQSHSGDKSPNWKGTGRISKSLLNHIVHYAKKRHIEFSLTPEYLDELFTKQNGKCSYSGVLLKLPFKDRDPNATASLDRINSSKGYIIGNVQWVHKTVNKMKMDLEEVEFIKFCSLVHKHRQCSLDAGGGTCGV